MKIVEFSKETETKVIEECASLYCGIFRESPWNEEWEANIVSRDMREQATIFGFQGLMATEEGEVIGFTWGYIISEQDMRRSAGHDKLDFLFTKGKKIFYVDELGVDSAHRGRGIGKKMSQGLIDLARNSAATTIILRTDKKAEAARDLYLRLGFEDLLIEDNVYKDRTYWRLDV